MTKHWVLTAGMLLLMVSAAIAQTYSMKTKVSSTETMELLEDVKKLFDASVSFSFTISTYDAERSFDDMNKTEPYDDNYLGKYQALLKTDTTDALTLNSLGNYYNFTGQSDLAQFYFNRAISHLSLKHCNNDSAQYYSLRGTMKLNLGMESAIEDMERAIIINPDDSIAGAFYPLLLINKRDFKKASACCARMLDKPGPYPHIPYVFLLSSELLSSFFQRAAEAGDDKLRQQYADTDFNALFDFSVVDKYAARFKENVQLQNVRMLADIFALSAKLVFFTGLDKPDPVFGYTTAEKNRLAELEKKFSSPEMASSLNPYTRLRALAFIYFMLQQNVKAVATFNEAIRIFPPDKRNEYFNLADTYDGMISIHYLVRDSAAERKTLEKKIAVMPLGKIDPNDYYRMAVHYFIAGDMRTAKIWADKAHQSDPNHFNTLRLLSHLSYLDASPAVETYAQAASKNIRTNDDQYNLVMQFAIYQLITGDATAAYGNIAIGRQSLEGASCELCDKLLNKYILISK